MKKKILMLVVGLMLTITTLMMTAQVTYAAAVYDHEVTFDMNGGDYVHSDIAEFGSKLDGESEPLSIIVYGDSTSYSTSTWFYQLGGLLASDYDGYSVQYRAWDSSTESYGDNVSLQYGNEGDAYALYQGSEDDSLETMDSEKLSITGDIDLRGKIKADAGTSGAIVSKWVGSTELSYFLYYSLNSSGDMGQLKLYWYDGTATQYVLSNQFAVDEDSELWVRATLDVDNGSEGYTVEFSTSDDNITYTVRDTEITTSGITQIYDSTALVTIGATSGGWSNRFSGKIYAVEIRDGIDGEIVASPDFDFAFPSTLDRFQDLEGNIWTIEETLEIGNGAPGLMLLNSSISGGNTGSYTAEKMYAMAVTEPDLIFINFGHNGDENTEYVEDIENFIDNINRFNMDPKIVLVTQNDQTSPRSTAQILAQEIRMDQVRLVAAKYDIALIDAGKILNTDSASYVGTDGVHPTEAGYTVWADTVYDALKNRTGVGSSTLSLLVEDGELINEPDAPVKSGATFVGWYTNEALTNEWDMDNDLVQDDMTLYAKWSDSVAISGTGGLITNTGGTYELFGVAWYWYAIGAALGIYYFGYTDSGRKLIGLKKRR